MNKSAELLPGTLDLLILRILSLQPLHGVGIANRIRQVTNGVFRIKAGSLFPALHRLEDKGWIEGSWGETEEQRRARFYSLTPSGQRQFNSEKRNWRRVVGAVDTVLDTE
jgi:PadR family transcriptional regulator PadR